MYEEKEEYISRDCSGRCPSSSTMFRTVLTDIYFADALYTNPLTGSHPLIHITHLKNNPAQGGVFL